MTDTSQVTLFVLAVLPACVVMFFVWKMDKREKEPFKMLLSLFGLGVLSIIPALILELIFEGIFNSMFASWLKELPSYYTDEVNPEELPFARRVIFQGLSYFIGVGLVEEAGKFLMMHLRSWKSPEFDFSYDAVVYAVATSLGFATFENIMYVFNGGISVAVMRAILSVPGHAIFAVFMGYYYGKAKYAKFSNDKKALRRNMWLSLIVPTAIHGFYDFCISMNSGAFILAFFLFELFITVFAIILIRKLSKNDHRVAAPRVPKFIGVPGMPGYPPQGFGGYPQQNGGQPVYYQNGAQPFPGGYFPNVPNGYPMQPNGTPQQPFAGAQGSRMMQQPMANQNMMQNQQPVVPQVYPNGYARAAVTSDAQMPDLFSNSQQTSQAQSLMNQQVYGSASSASPQFGQVNQNPQMNQQVYGSASSVSPQFGQVNQNPQVNQQIYGSASSASPQFGQVNQNPQVNQQIYGSASQTSSLFGQGSQNSQMNQQSYSGNLFGGQSGSNSLFQTNAGSGSFYGSSGNPENSGDSTQQP